MSKLPLIVAKQFPEFVQSEYPVFVEFVKAYYRWLDTQQIKYSDLVDIDNTEAEFVKYFRQRLDVYGLLDSTIPFDVRYIKNIKEIYASKGSEEALIYLLRVVRGAETEIQYPSEQILRASDGRWVQESFITLKTIFGSIETLDQWDFSYDCKCAGRQQPIPVTRTVVIDPFTIRFYFQRRSSITTFVGQRINVFSSTGVLLYTGQIVPSPTSVSVINGGKAWQLGQVIVIPGTVKNTVARVAEVDSNGSILRVEIVDFGFKHADRQSLTASPYPVKPHGSAYDIVSEIIGVNPPAYRHTLTVNDYTDGIEENVTGVMSGTFIGSYFLEDYVSPNYNGELVFEVLSTQTPTIETPFTDLTIEEWLASRATLALNFSDRGILKGRWVDDRGQVSNEFIKLEDNFYYQQFSYVIDSTENPTSYIELARNIHPVGLKLFTNYNLAETIELIPSVETSFPFVNIDLLDVSVVDAEITGKRIYKPRVDQVEISEDHYSTVDKYLTDSITITSPDTASVSISTNDSEMYFAEEYTVITKELILGV